MIAAMLLFLSQPGVSSLENEPDCNLRARACDAAAAAADAAAEEAARPLDPDDQCADPRSPQLMYQCAERDLASTEVALNEQWERTVAELENLDRQQTTEDPRPSYLETAQAAQNAWLAYREAQCEADGALSGRPSGRSTEVTLALQCKTYMTQLRIQELRLMFVGPY